MRVSCFTRRIFKNTWERKCALCSRSGARLQQPEGSRCLADTTGWNIQRAGRKEFSSVPGEFISVTSYSSRAKNTRQRHLRQISRNDKIFHCWVGRLSPRWCILQQHRSCSNRPSAGSGAELGTSLCLPDRASGRSKLLCLSRGGGSVMAFYRWNKREGACPVVSWGSVSGGDAM